MWNGSNIKFKDLELYCTPVADGILITYKDDITEDRIKYRLFNHKTLCEYIGNDMYSTFYNILKENANVTDFNINLVEDLSTKKLNDNIEIIKSNINNNNNNSTNSNNILQYWRDMKCILAGNSLIINEHNWNRKAIEIVDNCKNLKDYLKESLSEINSDASLFFFKQLTLVKVFLKDKSHKHCMGIIPLECHQQIKQEDNDWLSYFVISLFILILVFLGLLLFLKYKKM